MQKYLFALLCVTNFAYAELYENIEKAILDSNLETTRTLLDSPLKQQEYRRLMILADSMTEKRQKDYSNNHFRPFLSAEKLAWLGGIYLCEKIINLASIAPFQLITGICSHNSYQLKIGTRNFGLGIMAAGIAIFGIRSLWQSFSVQASELEKLYNNALTIKYLIASKANILQTTTNPAAQDQ